MYFTRRLHVALPGTDLFCPALKLRIVSFVPWNNNVEIMHIAIQNQSEKVQNLTPYAAIPIYGRSADNLRDHRNVTSMLHRIENRSKRNHSLPYHVLR